MSPFAPPELPEIDWPWFARLSEPLRRSIAQAFELAYWAGVADGVPAGLVAGLAAGLVAGGYLARRQLTEAR